MEEQIVASTHDANADSSPALDADQPAQTGESGAPLAPEAPKDQGAGPSGAEKRIQQLVARQREAERRESARSEEAAYWRGIAESRIRATWAPPTVACRGAPREPGPRRLRARGRLRGGAHAVRRRKGEVGPETGVGNLSRQGNSRPDRPPLQGENGGGRGKRPGASGDRE